MQVALAAALSPAALRIGGGAEENVVYEAGNYSRGSSLWKCSAEYQVWAPPAADPCRLLTKRRYGEVFEFSRAAGLRLVWGFSISYGQCCSWTCTGHCGSLSPTPGSPGFPHCGPSCAPFDPSNMIAMLQFMRESRQVPWAVQLGNEKSNDDGGSGAARRFVVLDDALTSLFGPLGSAGRPLVMGPDITDGATSVAWVTEFWSTLHALNRSRLLHAFTYHAYGGRGQVESAAELRNATVLQNSYAASAYERAWAPFNFTESGVQVWVGESAARSGGGVRGLTDSFASLYYYLDSLAATALANHSGFLRQDLVGAHYSLVSGCSVGAWDTYGGAEAGECRPNPDYWGALLFKRLMVGVNLPITVGHPRNESLRAYVQCNSTEGSEAGMTVLLINLLATVQAVHLDIPTSPRDYVEYSLTPPKGPLHEQMASAGVLLNGQLLSMLPGPPWIPALSGVTRQFGDDSLLVLRPLALTFLAVTGPAGFCHAATAFR